MKKIVFLFFILFLIGCGTEINEVKEGPFKVVKVIDGDTIELNNSLRVRFSGINTPEKDECGYLEAKEILSEIILNKEVYLETDKTDKGKYGRLLRYVYYEEVLLNSFLVENGYAKVYDKYRFDTKRYDELKEVEKIAKENNLRVWNC